MSFPPARSYVQAQSPPSTYAIASLVDGEPGAGGRVFGLTLERALVIGTGLWLAGIRGDKLVRSALLASSTVTAWIVLDYMTRQRGAPGLTPFSE